MDGVKIMIKAKIDCSKVENYFAEIRRMTGQREHRVCQLNCVDCPLSKENNSMSVSCVDLGILYPKKAIEIVQKWSDEHPPKTYLSEFLKNYPNTLLDEDGTPSGICLSCLGLIDKNECGQKHSCIECWNQLVEE